jgi:anti-sigma regulatory factor (Ser/Thr protein kinase)
LAILNRIQNSQSGATENSTTVTGRFSQLPKLLALLASVSGNPSVASDPEVDRQILLRASLAVEELFANSIHHGYRGESDNPVWLRVEHHDAFLRLTYADAAPAFDPFSDIVPVNLHPAVSLPERRIGGLGRILMREMASHCEYRHEAGRNVVVLEYDLGRQHEVAE